MGVYTGTKRAFPPGNWDYEVSLLIPTNSFNFCTDSCIFRYDTHIAQEPGSLFRCHTMMSNVVIHSCRLFCLQRQVARLATDCSIVGLYCVTITWKQIFKDSIPISLFVYCNDSLLPGTRLTLRKSQIHCSGVRQWWAYSSLMSTLLPAEAGCETSERIVLSLVSIV